MREEGGDTPGGGGDEGEGGRGRTLYDAKLLLSGFG